MRIAAPLLLALMLGGCGERAATPLASGGPPGPQPSGEPKTAGPAASGQVRYCHVDYFARFTRLETLADGAGLIVTGVVTDLRSAQERYGEVRYIVLRPSWTRKAPGLPTTLTIVESPCPAVDVTVGDEVTAFLQPFSSDSTPRAAGLYSSLGGPQAVFVARGGAIRPPERGEEARVVAAYAGRSTADLQADVMRIRPADGDARSLFERYGWRVIDRFTIQEITLPFDFEAPGRAQLEEPFATYSRASAAIGLGLRPYARKDAELLRLTLERERADRTPAPPIGYALIVDRQVVGAWVQVYPTREVFALDRRDAALAAPASSPPPPTERPNRFPDGVNLASAYQLATADSVSLLRSDGRGVAAAVVGVAATLDVRLATVSARQAGRGEWSVVFAYGRNIEPFVYEVTTNMLTHQLDGFAVQAPDAFRRLIEAAR